MSPFIAPEVLVATTDVLPGYFVQAVLGEVIGVAVRTLSPYTEGFRSLRDGSSCPPEVRLSLLTQARAEAVDRMRNAARARGANAVIAMRFDHRQVTETSNEVCAYGTAVIVTPRSPVSAAALNGDASGDGIEVVRAAVAGS